MSDVRNIKGLDELQKFLDQVPVKMETNIMRGALRAGMREIQPVAQANVHSVSGQLAAGLVVSTRRKGSTVTARLRATGPHAFVAHILEFTGAAAHWILARRGSALMFGGRLVSAVHHPGVKVKPFMRPALYGQATAAVLATGEYIKRRLASKAGLDTSGVLLKGDE